VLTFPPSTLKFEALPSSAQNYSDLQHPREKGRRHHLTLPDLALGTRGLP